MLKQFCRLGMRRVERGWVYPRAVRLKINISLISRVKMQKIRRVKMKSWSQNKPFG